METTRKPFRTIGNLQNLAQRDAIKRVPTKVTKSVCTQTETELAETGCGTSDEAAEAMVTALTGGTLNETYYETLAESRREALEIVINENEELESKCT